MAARATPFSRVPNSVQLAQNWEQLRQGCRWGCTQGRGPLQWHLENVEATTSACRGGKGAVGDWRTAPILQRVTRSVGSIP